MLINLKYSYLFEKEYENMSLILYITTNQPQPTSEKRMSTVNNLMDNNDDLHSEDDPIEFFECSYGDKNWFLHGKKTSR